MIDDFGAHYQDEAFRGKHMLSFLSIYFMASFSSGTIVKPCLMLLVYICISMISHPFSVKYSAPYIFFQSEDIFWSYFKYILHTESFDREIFVSIFHNFIFMRGFLYLLLTPIFAGFINISKKIE